MRLGDGRESDNIEDRRGARGGGMMGGGGRKIGIGTIVLALVAMYFGVDPSVVLNMGAGVPQTSQQAPVSPGVQSTGRAEDDALARFTAQVLADTEDTWNELFRAGGKQYREPKLVLYTGGTQTACGTGQAAMGPFYCPGDERVYLDLDFYRDLQARFAAPGDFAQAYVIAHEIGHHVQHQLGIAEKVQVTKQRVSEREANQLQVRMELQADCFAGIWAHHADRSRGILEQGDIEEALRAASAIGDDTLQKQAQGYVVPESFTHGSAEQRVRWFKRGLDSGEMKACDSFGARAL
ncbi:neutral zinc metallopeptidase [Methyloversatilis sp.]|uniref:KPN_02809 family neutral zinc metallopeptidase n=1 Tax=Methyloversatilis sp. TaxID=2569862 RepID=UPI00273297FC|nr:neutral zinc metallopeptidase [Methyloversatilis sp.]MDP2795509.1 neutral zinc metallopeptidase [Sulfurisoma sp.]MDP3286720.1 neutral zinc metallopeptidase [Methyloversatilis sp.]MDP3457142.1 neutral zinc metallopeptidase [Methyloversatilis sp.]MDP3576771.1 neutral zinc metallopeptidase [Methyloversatilis sp.]